MLCHKNLEEKQQAILKKWMKKNNTMPVFSMDECVSTVISSSMQVLHALHILKSNGMSNACLQAVFKSIIISHLMYASQAWHGFASRASLDRVDSFLRSVKAGFYPPKSTTFEELCDALNCRAKAIACMKITL